MLQPGIGLDLLQADFALRGRDRPDVDQREAVLRIAGS